MSTHLGVAQGDSFRWAADHEDAAGISRRGVERLQDPRYSRLEIDPRESCCCATDQIQAHGSLSSPCRSTTRFASMPSRKSRTSTAGGASDPRRSGIRTERAAGDTKNEAAPLTSGSVIRQALAATSKSRRSHARRPQREPPQTSEEGSVTAMIRMAATATHLPRTLDAGRGADARGQPEGHPEWVRRAADEQRMPRETGHEKNGQPKAHASCRSPVLRLHARLARTANQPMNANNSTAGMPSSAEI